MQGGSPGAQAEPSRSCARHAARAPGDAARAHRIRPIRWTIPRSRPPLPPVSFPCRRCNPGPTALFSAADAARRPNQQPQPAPTAPGAGAPTNPWNAPVGTAQPRSRTAAAAAAAARRVSARASAAGRPITPSVAIQFDRRSPATRHAHNHARNRSVPAGGPARRRSALSARVRPRRRRRQPPALGLAVPPQSEQSRRPAAALGRARRADDHRPLRDDARASVARRKGNSGRVGHRRHGGARAPAARSRRRAVPHVGPQRRRRAWTRSVRGVVARS